MTSKCGDHSAIDFVLAEVIEDLIKLAGQAIRPLIQVKVLPPIRAWLVDDLIRVKAPVSSIADVVVLGAAIASERCRSFYVQPARCASGVSKLRTRYDNFSGGKWAAAVKGRRETPAAAETISSGARGAAPDDLHGTAASVDRRTARREMAP